MEEPNIEQKYRAIVELGQGGMAEVFLAISHGHAGFNKLVVLKKTRPELSRDPELIAMFLDEARLAGRLSHHNIVQTHEVGQDGDRHFIAMEYLEGQSLNRFRRRSSAEESLPLALHLRVLAETLAGLHYAHELKDFDGTSLGIVHRDVSPHNVFVTYEGHVKVVDFGIAKAAGASLETRHGIIKGKVGYMPPEQATARPVDRRADIFACGVMLWEAITGRKMWRETRELVVIHRLSQGDIPRIRDVKTDGVDPELERIAERALAVNPADRYATAAAMQADLERYLDGLAEKSSAREISRYMIARFTEERSTVQRLVESKLSDLRWSGPTSSSKVVVLAPPPASSSDLGSGRSEPLAPTSNDAAPSARTPTRVSLATNVETPQSAATPVSASVDETRSAQSPTAPLSSSPIHETPLSARVQALVGSPAIVDTRIDVTSAPRPAGRSESPLRSALAGAAIMGVLAVGAYVASQSASRAHPSSIETAAITVTPSASAPVAARRTACPEGMVLIPGGRFYMGSDEHGFDLWAPAHRVTLDTFCVDVYEVTAGDYKTCSDTGNCQRPDPIPSYPKTAAVSEEKHTKNRAAYAELCNFGKPERANHPINCLSWALADNYCKVRNTRLPTEAEWELAARGSDGRKYPWGDEAGDQRHMNACGTECNAWEEKHGITLSSRMYDTEDGYPGTAPVGSFPAGKTIYGAHDFIGNVWEWTSDWFETYKPGDAINPTGAPAGNRKAIRGGGFNGGARLWLDPAFRYHQIATASAPAIGFRCAMSL